MPDQSTASRIALLPCPFCGGEGALNEGDGVIWAECTTCNLALPYQLERDEAIAAWNTRAKPDGWVAPGKITKEDVDFIKSMCFQGPDMTERQERRVLRVIDELRLIAAAVPTPPVLPEGEKA